MKVLKTFCDRCGNAAVEVRELRLRGVERSTSTGLLDRKVDLCEVCAKAFGAWFEMGASGRSFNAAAETERDRK